MKKKVKQHDQKNCINSQKEEEREREKVNENDEPKVSPFDLLLDAVLFSSVKCSQSLAVYI